MSDWYAIGATAACISCLVGVLGFWMLLQRQITEGKAEAAAAITSANEAKADAAAANTAAKDANLRALAVDKVLALFKEQVARDYVSHAMLDKTEIRLIAAIETNIKPLTEAVRHLTERFDNYRDRT